MLQALDADSSFGVVFQDIALVLPLTPSGLDAELVIVDRQSKIVPFFSLNR
jgi:hypothetical protein